MKTHFLKYLAIIQDISFMLNSSHYTNNICTNKSKKISNKDDRKKHKPNESEKNINYTTNQLNSCIQEDEKEHPQSQ